MTAQLYEIVVRGKVGGNLARAVGFDIVSSNVNETRFRGWVIDQAALLGVIDRISSFGFELKSIKPFEDPL